MRLIFKKTILLTAFICIVIGQAHATKRYWIASAPAFWNSSSNWSSASGGSGGASVPTSVSQDTAYFDGNGLGTCKIDMNVTVVRFEIKSTYTDTVKQNAYTITVGIRSMILDGGVFIGSSSNITVGSHYNNSACKFKSTSGTLEVQGDFKLTGTGSFTHNNGIVKFTYNSNFSSTTATNTTSSATKELYALTLETSGSSNVKILTVTSGNTLTANGTLTISGDGEYRIMTGTIEAKGDISVTNTKAGSATGTGTGTILIDGSGTQHLSGTSGDAIGHLPKITITKSSSDSLFLSNYINIKNDFTYNSGKIIYGTSKVILSATLTMTGNVKLGEVWIYPVAAHTTITIASGTTVTVYGTLRYNTVSTSYIVTVNTGTIAAKGDIVLSNISNTGANGGGTATLLINDSINNQTLTGPTALYTSYLPNVTINKTGGTLYLQNFINAVGNWTYTAGTINAGTSTLIPYGNFIISGSHTLYNVKFPGFNTYTHTLATGTTLTTTGTLSFAGTAIIAVNGGTLEAKGNITNSNTSGGGSTNTTNILINGTGSQTFTGPGATAISYLPKITINKSSGTLHLRSTINVIGDWVHTAGTIDADSSTIVFYGSHTISGKNTLKNVTFSGAASYTHTIPSGDTLTATGTLAFAGSSAITVNTGALLAQGDISITNTSASSGTGSSVIQINGTGSQTITGSGVLGTGHLPKIIINKSSGTLSLASIISANNDWTYTAGTIDPGTSTVGFYGSHTITGSHTLKNVTFPGNSAYTHTIASGTTLTTTGTLRLQGSSAITFNTGTLNAQGDITAVNTSTVTTSGTATILIDGTANQKFTGQGTSGKGYLPKISVNKTGGTLSLDSTLSLINDWSYTAGTIDASTYSNKVYFYGTHNASCQGTSTTMCFHDVFFAGTTSLNGNFKAAHDLTINTGNTLTQGNYDINVGRNWTHNGTWTVGTGINTFDGTYLGTITRASSATETFPKLVINKSSNRVEYNVPIIVSTSLALTKGAVKTTNSSLFTINSGVTVTGGSDSSYIEAQIKKIGNAAFTFPLGSTTYTNANYHPVSITAPSSSTDAYTAQYYATGQTLGNTIHTAGIENIGICDYWGLARTTGSSNVTPSIEWSATTCNLQTDLYQEMAYWDTTNHYWVGLGIGSGSGYNSSTLRTNCTSASTLTFVGTIATYIVPVGKASLLVNATVTHKSDSITSDGSIVLSVSGGSTPYTYLWGGSQTTSSITGLSAGVYSVTVTDNLGSQVKKYFFVGSTGSSSTYTITPDAITGKDASIMLGDDGTTDLTNNYGTTGNYECSHTTSGLAQKTRGLLSFDLSSFPNDVKINSATLNLYGVGGNVNGTGAQPTNQAYLMRVGQSWNENRVNWSNQPNAYSGDQITLAATSNSTQDYFVDVTSHVKKFIANPYANNGWMIQLANETATNALSIKLGSSDNSNSALRPSLVISITIRPNCDLSRNWVKQTVYGEEGEIISESKSFSDNLGRGTQSQTLMITDGVFMASQSLYDGFGRAIGQTLPAPTNQETFCYKTNFATNGSGANYGYNDFDKPISSNASGEVNNPAAFDNSTAGTVGWYYSNNNTTEPFVATTAYPYNRVEYYNNPMGVVKRSSSVDAALKMGGGHESRVFNMSAAGELDFIYGNHGTYNLNEDFTQITGAEKSENLQLYKTVTVNADGKESISYTNSAGQPIASCLSGVTNGCTPQAVLQGIKHVSQGFTPVHIPKSYNTSVKVPVTCIACVLNLGGTSNSHFNYLLNDQGASTPVISYVIEDMETQKILTEGTDYSIDRTTRALTFSGGYTGKSLYLNIAYDIIGTTASNAFNSMLGDIPEIGLSYTLDYCNWNLNYYDNKGRAIGSVAPNDVNCTTVFQGTASHIKKDQASFMAYPPSYEPHIVPSTYASSGTIQDVLLGLTISYDNSSSGGSTSRTYPSGYSFSHAQPKSSFGRMADTLTVMDSTTFYQTIAELDTVTNRFRTVLAVTDSTKNLIELDSTGATIDTIYDTNVAKQIYAGVYLQYTFTYKLAYHTTSGGTLNYYTLPGASSPQTYSVTYNLSFDVNTGQGFVGLASPSDISINVPSSIVSSYDIGLYLSDQQVAVYGLSGISNTPYTFGNGYSIPTGSNIGSILWGKICGEYADNLKGNYTEVVDNFYYATSPQIMSTKNYYDTRNRIVATETTDEGRKDVIYDDESKVRFSQNDKQRTASIGGRFSYVNYDTQGRPVESGEYDPNVTNTGITKMYFQTQAQYDASTNTPPSGSTSLITVVDQLDGTDDIRCNLQSYVAYDEPDGSIPTISGASPTYAQKHTSAKVSKTWNSNSTTWYSYDEQGQNTWTIQNINGLGNKTQNNTYSLFGKLLQTAYQKETSGESFYHKYEYDADQRLVNTSTSLDNSTWTQQSKNYYYTHGPLKRTELGNSLQGLDYVYTITGALKSVNDPYLTASDPGGDSYTGAHSAFSKDVFAYSLDYFSNDYVRSGTGIQTYTTSSFSGANNLYSGTIKAVRWQTQLPTAATNNFTGALMYEYNYDYKYQLNDALFGQVVHNSGGSTPTNSVTPVFTDVLSYKVTNLNYDLTGNITNLKRYGYIAPGDDPYAKDDLTYNYSSTKKNRLLQVSDAMNTVTGNEYDFPHQSNTANYTYDEIGQLTGDEKDDIKTVYDANGLVTAINVKSTNVAKVSFLYNDKGLRQKKTVYNSGGSATDHYWYAYNAGGTLLSTYHTVVSTSTTTQEDLYMYGGGRLGSYNKTASRYFFELSDHLGNVRAVVAKNTSSSAVEVLSFSDYYPHGGVLPSRNYVTTPTYHFNGVQGNEKDNETTLTNFELRQFDPRLGRWFAPDPRGQYHSPYLAMSNNPITMVDPSGGWSGEGCANYLDAGYNSAFEMWSATHNADQMERGEAMQSHFDNRQNYGMEMHAALVYNRNLDRADNTEDTWKPDPGSITLPEMSITTVRKDLHGIVQKYLNATTAISQIIDGATVSMRYFNGAGNKVLGDITFIGKLGQGDGKTWSKVVNTAWVMAKLSAGDYKTNKQLSEGVKKSILNIPNWRAEDYGEVTGGVVEGILVSKGIGEIANFARIGTVATEAAEGGLQYSDDLLKTAQELYPKKAGKVELHHITPKYLGGAKNGALVPLDASYHQVITNEFRALWPYGKGIPSASELQNIMRQVYSKFPLPPGY